VRSGGATSLLNQNWDGDLTGANGLEWAAFADGTINRSLFLAHADDGITDTYWQMGGDAGMTVFGFGREAGSLNTFLSTTPHPFYIGLVDTRDGAALSQAVCAASALPSTTVGGLEVFGDQDGDGLSDGWEIHYFGRTNAGNGNPYDDWDLDTFINLHEERAGTDPTRAASLLVVAHVLQLADGQLVVAWPGAEGITYTLMSTTDLSTGFTNKVAEYIEAVLPLTSWTNGPPVRARDYFRVQVE
jgi:hypothetical protein